MATPLFYDVYGEPVKLGDTVGFTEFVENKVTPDAWVKSYVLVEWDNEYQKCAIQELLVDYVEFGYYVPDSREPVIYAEYYELAAI